MDPFIAVSIGLVLAVLALVVVIRIYSDKVARLREEVRTLGSSRAALASTHERVSAQWAPVLARYPYDPRNFRFVGAPVDGVQFEEDRIVFVEFSSGELSLAQQRVRDLVHSGKVEWLEVRTDQAPPEPASPDAPADAWAHNP